MDDGPYRVIGEGKYLRLVARGRWEYAERTTASGAVVIVAVTDEERLILVEQPRPAIGGYCIELPAGLVGDEPEIDTDDLLQAAERELLEETGYRAEEMRLLAGGPPSAGLASEIITFFHAARLSKVAAGGGVKSEKIVVHEVPLRAVEEWLREKAAEGLAIDPKIYVGLYFCSSMRFR